MEATRGPCLRQHGDKPVQGQADGSGRDRIKGLEGSSGAKAGAGWDSSHLSVGAENQMSAFELSLVTLNSPYRQWREIAK